MLGAFFFKLLNDARKNRVGYNLTQEAEMPISTRVAMLIGLIASHGLCQTNAAEATIQPSRQEDLLRAIGAFVSLAIPGSAAANGPEKPAAQEALGLTDQEVQILKAVAKDYQTKNELFLAALGPLKMESLLQSLDAGLVAEGVARSIRDLQNEHSKMVSDQIRKLEVALGTSRVDALAEVVRSGKWAGLFGPTVQPSK
jgi:hypothetical protein